MNQPTTTANSPRVPVSMLDLATVREGHDSADALNATTAVAQAADVAGYKRFWVAEHHNLASVASTSPAVLIAHLAAQTKRIHLGSGGVMLPNHTPFVVSEQFSLLEALHPGRIDLGLGRAAGTDPATAVAIRGSSRLSADQFPEHLTTILAHLGDARFGSDSTAGLVVTPRPASYPQVWMLGSSTGGASIAAAYGLPYTYAHHFPMSNQLDQALEVYRSRYQPSPAFPEPRVMVTASVVVAETQERAEYLAGPSEQMVLSMMTGSMSPLVSPDVANRTSVSEKVREVLAAMPGTQYAGTADQVVAGLQELVDRTGADELMITGYEYDLVTRIESVRRLARAWGLSERTADVVAA